MTEPTEATCPDCGRPIWVGLGSKVAGCCVEAAGYLLTGFVGAIPCKAVTIARLRAEIAQLLARPSGITLPDQSELCKCGCPKTWHVPYHAHSKLSAPMELCACYEFESAKPEPLQPNTRLLVFAVRSALETLDDSESHAAYKALSELENRIGAKRG